MQISLNFYTKTVKFFNKDRQLFFTKINLSYKNRPPFLQKSSQFLVKVVRFSSKNHKNFLTKIDKCSQKNCQVISQKLLNFFVNRLDFPAKITKFLWKFWNFSVKNVKFFCNDHQLFFTAPNPEGEKWKTMFQVTWRKRSKNNRLFLAEKMIRLFYWFELIDSSIFHNNRLLPITTKN